MGDGAFIQHFRPTVNPMQSSSPINFKFWQQRHLPIVLQTETAECGLACLTMVRSYWGYKTDMASMRRRFTVSLKGVNLKSLMTMAAGIGLSGRPIKVELEQLAELTMPCILHWDMNHFVVLKSVSRTHAVIHDPAVGLRRVLLQDLSKHFTGVVLELTPSSNFSKGEEILRFSLFALMGRVVGLKRGLLKLLVLGFALQVCALVTPFYMQWLVDNALVAADRNMITVLGIGFLLLVLVQTSIAAVRSWIATVISTKLNMQWLGNAFAHLMHLPLPYFEKRHTGDIVSRFSSIQTMQRTLTTQFVEGIIDGVLVLTTLLMMLAYSATLTAVTAIATLLYVLLRWAIFRTMREANAEQIVHASRQQSHFLESVRGIQSLRLSGRGEERRAGWLNALADQLNTDLRIARLSLSYQTSNTLLFSAERVIVIWLAALSVLSGQLSIGMMFAFISYKEQFAQRVVSLVDKLFEFRMLRLHGERVADILMSEAEAVHVDVELNPALISPSIEFCNVSFRYSDSEPLVLSNLNLSIPAGQAIAITGPSGSGKTTFMKLMLGLLEPTDGHLLVGGVKLASLGAQNFRAMLGVVMQDDNLFAGSIQDNISFFDAKPDSERVQHCARLAAIHDEIMVMPMAYHTLVGEIGSALSGGQKQRLLLARALYREPRILVLDEATSHLDVANEGLVNRAIRHLALTRIMVAHRPETIAMADRVVVLAQGKIQRDTLKQPPGEMLSM
jgi:ATP-binding cassette subfamily B protein RaxB